MVTAPYQDFAGRLHKALDRARFPADRARTGALATRYAVTRETARKWLAGLALPELERMISLATEFRVSFEWLATGRGDMLMRSLVQLGETVGDYVIDEDCARLHAWVDTMTPAQRKALLVVIGKA